MAWEPQPQNIQQLTFFYKPKQSQKLFQLLVFPSISGPYIRMDSFNTNQYKTRRMPSPGKYVCTPTQNCAGAKPW